MVKWVVGVLALAACGRMGFEPDDGGGPLVETVLPCGSPIRFTTGGVLTALAAVPTPTGFAIIGVDKTRALVGWAYDWHADALEPTAERVLLGGEILELGATSTGDDVVVAAVFGDPTAPLGTRLYPLGSGLAMRGPVVERAEIAGAHPVTTSGLGDDLALITIDPTTKQVDACPLTTAGEAGEPRKIVDGAERASTVSIAPAHSGYLATWTDGTSSPNQPRVALLDAELGIVAGPVSANTTLFDATGGHAVWAATVDRYLAAWYAKNASNDDEVWIQILDSRLEPTAGNVSLAQHAHTPAIASDRSGFWVTYLDASGTPKRLAAAHVDADGLITPRPVPHSGGHPTAWAVTTRADQSVLVWVEDGGTGPELYFDPLCR